MIWLALISEVIKSQQTSWTIVKCLSTKNKKYEKDEEWENRPVRRSTNCTLHRMLSGWPKYRQDVGATCH